MFNRDKDILTSLTDLDLTPTMEKNARDKYGALSKYLAEHNLDSDFYPQGSFLIGTTIRPYRNGQDHDYDLDILAILKRDKKDTDAKSVKYDVGNCIKNSGIYGEKLEKEDRNCWTLKYADITNGIGFALDLVPSVDESNNIKEDIKRHGVNSAKAEKSVAITDKTSLGYKWLTSNPLGFGDWFLEISDKHLTLEMINEQYNYFSDDIKMMSEKAEEIPKYYYKSNLQRAVQFIKRHRDIYYDRSQLNQEKPSSMIISALVADSVKNAYSLSIYEIIVNFINGYENKSISIIKDDRILNPVDLRENLIEKYSYDRLKGMDKWISVLKDFISVEEEVKFKQNIHNDINIRAFSDSFGKSAMILPTKPWKK